MLHHCCRSTRSGALENHVAGAVQSIEPGNCSAERRCHEWNQKLHAILLQARHQAECVRGASHVLFLGLGHHFPPSSAGKSASRLASGAARLDEAARRVVLDCLGKVVSLGRLQDVFWIHAFDTGPVFARPIEVKIISTLLKRCDADGREPCRSPWLLVHGPA
ncbi:hypothetical protein BC567DRAFT_69754 [Phyllosticta citribraziliensis]